jgi:hypothetical protein
VTCQEKRGNGGALVRCPFTGETEKRVEIGTEKMADISKLETPGIRVGIAEAQFRICSQMAQWSGSWAGPEQP